MTSRSSLDPRGSRVLLLFSVFVVAVCGLVYELLAGAISSYLVGNSVTQFSIVIGLFMSAMGLGSYLSRFIEERLVDRFVQTQLVVGVLGGFSALLLYAAFATLETYLPVLVLMSLSVGTLVGLEIPLVVRILREHTESDRSLSDVLTLDYVGALAASLLFPLVLIPYLGLARSGLFFGLVNVAVAAACVVAFRRVLAEPRGLAIACGLAAALLGAGLAQAGRISSLLEDRLYHDEIVASAQTPHQRMVLTRSGDDVRLFIDGSIQFDSRDEYRYHESLVHPALMATPRREHVLIIGGGDGLAAREVWKYPDVGRVTLVDIDPAITDLFTRNPLLRGLNRDALRDPRMQVINADAWKFLETTEDIFDAVIVDLPDPREVGLSRFYSRAFYRLIARRLSARGVIATQATSPLYAREAFWCIRETLDGLVVPSTPDAPLQALAYHAYVPSFGEWGFVLATRWAGDWDELMPDVETRFLSTTILPGMRIFPEDMARVDVEPNSLDRHPLVEYYRNGWEAWRS